LNPLAIPEIVIRRIPLYLRTLALLREQGQTVTSSQEIGDRLGISATQIRKDLSYFGEFGKQGTGYVIGAGHLGKAILSYGGFEEGGFSIAAVLDKDRRKIGSRIGDLEVQDIASLPEAIAEHHVRIAVVAVPVSDAQDVVDALVDAGVKAILSYAPSPLALPEDVHVEYIDPVVGLQSMTYYLDPLHR